MEKIRIKIGIINWLPFDFDHHKVKKWKSDVFEVIDISNYVINTSKVAHKGEYTDEMLEEIVPENDSDSDIFIGVSYFPFEKDYYLRRLEKNRVIVSYHGIYKHIVNHNISEENLVLRSIYSSVFVLMIAQDRIIIPSKNNRVEFSHDYTVGCIYDMNSKDESDVIHSLHKPLLCCGCQEKLKQRKIPIDTIEQVNRELLGIRRSRFSQIVEFIKKRPVYSMIITFTVSVIISLIANFISNLVIIYVK